MSEPDFVENIDLAQFPPRRPYRERGPWGAILLVLLGIVFTPPLLLVLTELWALQDRRLPSMHEEGEYEPLVQTRLYASNGDLIATTGGAPRLLVAKLPPALGKALVARLDPDFMTRDSIGQRDLVRALVDGIRGHEWKVPLTLRLAQSLDDEALGADDHGAIRKLKDYLVAIRLEHNLPRAELIDIYLTQRTFGGGGYGVEMGALGHFNRSVTKLDPKELTQLVTFDTGEIGKVAKPVPGRTTECGQAAVRQLATRLSADVIGKLGATVQTTCDPLTLDAAQESIDKRHLERLGLTTSVAVMRLPGREVVALLGAPEKSHPIGILRAPFVIGSALESLKWTAITPVSGMALRTFVGRSPAGAADALLAVGLPKMPAEDLAARCGVDGGEAVLDGKMPITTTQAIDVLGSLAMQGERGQPQLLVSMTRPNGKTEPLAVKTRVQGMSAEVASLMTAFLSRPVRSSLNRPSAGLTGTEASSTWLGVYTPDLAVAVWLGQGEAGKPSKSGEVEKIAVQIALDIMAVDLKDKPAVPFTRAQKLFVRRVDDKGNLVPRGVAGGTEEWFVPNSVRREDMELAPDPSQDHDPPEKTKP